MNNDNVWDFSKAVTQRLLSWNILNILTGVWLVRRGGFWRGVGSQSIGWGLINVAIAIFGARATEKRRRELANPNASKEMAKETRNMRWILWFNAGLDLLYMYGGWRFARSRIYKNRVARGAGYGIILQGLLLFIFDTTQAKQVPTISNIRESNL